MRGDHDRSQRRPASPLFELRAPIEWGLFSSVAPLLNLPPILDHAPRGEKRSVLVMPGFLADDTSTLPLRLVLRRLGHRPARWKLGRNLGPTPTVVAGIIERLQGLAAERDGRVSIVGWSLGGLYGRGLATWFPDLVDQVITLGSPFNIDSDESTTVSPVYDWLESRERFLLRSEVALGTVPVASTAIYSRTDGVVSWQSCIQEPGPQAENIEVHGSHCGLGVNGAALYVVADRLAQSAGRWRPFQPPRHLRSLYPRPADWAEAA